MRDEATLHEDSDSSCVSMEGGRSIDDYFYAAQLLACAGQLPDVKASDGQASDGSGDTPLCSSGEEAEEESTPPLIYVARQVVKSPFKVEHVVYAPAHHLHLLQQTQAVAEAQKGELKVPPAQSSTAPCDWEGCNRPLWHTGLCTMTLERGRRRAAVAAASSLADSATKATAKTASASAAAAAASATTFDRDKFGGALESRRYSTGNGEKRRLERYPIPPIPNPSHPTPPHPLTHRILSYPILSSD